MTGLSVARVDKNRKLPSARDFPTTAAMEEIPADVKAQLEKEIFQ